MGAIYNLLNAIQTTQERHDRRLEEIGQEVNAIQARQRRQDNRLEEFGQELAGLRRDVGTILEFLRAGGQPTH
ncbi:MAG: hypothetical protein DLM54_07215 [Acidimicrobiales bacterium]|nr:MAG: hypothetical protein DLM54_07215 [Acidimicrobiales bacterium]